MTTNEAAKKKDWNGNSKAVFTTHGASNHSDTEREVHDYYATPPIATELLCGLETFSQDILEPCCGEGHIAKVLEAHGYNVESFDLIDRGFGKGGVDFLHYNEVVAKDIISNPPYCEAAEFVEHAMDIVTDGHKVVMFLKLTFLEGQGRRSLFAKYPPKTIYVSVSRLGCAKNGEFKTDKNGNLKADSAVAYCWFVWEKGFKGSPEIRWFN